jgi:hypothetical protein
MVSADAAADVIIPCDGLSEIEENRAGRIGRMDFVVARDDFLWKHGRTVTFALAEGLGVVGLVILHPCDDGGIIFVFEGEFILVADEF